MCAAAEGEGGICDSPGKHGERERSIFAVVKARTHERQRSDVRFRRISGYREATLKSVENDPLRTSDLTRRFQ